MKKIYTTGVFDILHKGHINILKEGSALGNLVVGLMTDEGVEKAKGSRPILTFEERAEQLRSLPFVSGVIPYSEIDQRPQYLEVRPDVVIQGDDWLHTADRTSAIAFLKENNIQLVLLPRTEGISTSEIKKRVSRSIRKDESFLLERVQLVRIDDLKLYEEYDMEKVRRLVVKMEDEQIFRNPISITKEMIVIDGNNRLQAAKIHGAKFIPAVVYDYKEIDLVGNVHFKVGDKITRLSEFAREEGERIEFPARTPDDIRQAIKNGEMIPNGETFHRVPQSVIHLPVPLKNLVHGFNMKEFLKDNISKGAIRFYQAGVYVCDEW